MSGLKHAGSFRDLIVYQKSRTLAKEIKITTQSFPKNEKFSLTDQVRRSSRAVGANIAESWAKRRYEKHFISKLTDSDGGKWKPSIGSELRWIAITSTKNPTTC